MKRRERLMFLFIGVVLAGGFVWWWLGGIFR